MGFIFGIIALTIAVVEEVILGATIGYTILGLYVIVVPIGAFILGGFIGFMISIGVKKSKVPISKKHILFALTLSLLLIPAVYEVNYASTYVGSDGSINQRFEGEHISNFTIDGQEMNYIEYIKYTLEYSDFTLKVRHAGSPQDFGTNSMLNYILLFANIIAAGIAASLVLYMVKGSSLICKKCKTYFVEKKICLFDKENYALTIEAINNALLKGKQFVGDFSTSNKEDFFSAEVYYCPDCYEGYIIIKHMILNDNSDLEEVEGDRITSRVEDVRNVLPVKDRTVNKSTLKYNKTDTSQSTPFRGTRKDKGSYDELVKLKELLDSEVITQDDFDAKKKQILGL